MGRADDIVRRVRRAAFLSAVAATSMSCGRDVPTSHVDTAGTQPPTPGLPRRVVGIAEVVFRDIGAMNVSVSIRVAATVAELEQLRATAGTTGSVDGIRFEGIAAGMFDYTAVNAPAERFFRGTFGLRNTRRDSVLFVPARENLSFVAVSTSQTLANTPVRSFVKEDGAPAVESLARQLTPTSLSVVNADGKLVDIASNVWRPVTGSEERNTATLSGTAALFPYAFVVRRLAAGLTTGASATQGPFDGVVTFSYRIPQASSARDNPSALSVLFLIVNDTTA